MVDYPNSKKARKVFLCLFVGDGGGQQVPKGLQGDEAATESEGVEGKATFEKRRQRESRRERNGKQKVVKGGRDWILRKKDVRGAHQIRHVSPLITDSYTGDEERRTCLSTQNTQVAKGEQCSRGRPFITIHGLYCNLLR